MKISLYVIHIFLVLNVIGCTLSMNITDLNSVSKMDMDKEAPIIVGAIDDGFSFGSLSSTPTFVWSAAADKQSGVDHYEIAIGSNSGIQDVLNWSSISDQNFNSQSGLALTKGSTYFPMVRAVDKNGNVSQPIYGDGWIATTLLSFLQPSTSIITGEATILSLVGGETPYAFNDSGSGYINTTSGVYTAPLNINPFVETVTGQDSVGQVATSQIKVRAFELKDSFKLDSTSPLKNATAYDIGMYDANTLFSVGYGSDINNVFRWLVKKSTDAGATWTLVDDYQLFAGKTSMGRKIKVNSSGAIYVIGVANDSANISHGIVRRSQDGGSTWVTIDDFQLSSGKSSSTNDLTFDSAGNIYSVGYGYDASDYGHWIIRKSLDGGASWIVVDDFAYAATFISMPNSIHIDNSGNIFVAGDGLDSSNVFHWLVRKSSDNGLSWSTVDDYILAAGKDSNASAIIADSIGTLYTVGFAEDSGGKSFWVVRKSSDLGATWGTVDSFQYIATRNALAQGVAVNNSGHIFVTGYGLETSWNHVITRRSTDGGATWAIIDDYLYSASGHNYSYAVTLNNLGDIFTAGYGKGPSSALGWTIRKSSDNGATWSNVDYYGYVAGSQAIAKSIAYDPINKVLFSSGSASSGDTLNLNHWIVRKSIDNGVTWITIDDFQLASGNGPASPNKITFINGTLYALGMAYNSSGYPRWIVRSSVNNGVTWNTIDDWSLSGGLGNISAADIIVDSANNIYVAGSAADGSLVSHAIVRKSTNGGSSWSVITNYQLAVGKSSTNTGMSIDSNGSLYTVGQGVDSANSRFWLVRKSTDGGSTWSIVDSFQWSVGKEAYASSIHITSSNEIYVAGQAKDNSSSPFWFVRKSTDGGSTWSTVDNFQHVTGQTAMALTITSDQFGNIYTGGYALDAASFYKGIIRKSSNSGSTWTTVETLNSIIGGTYISINSLIPCLSNQICAAGSSYINTKGNVEYTVKILSPE